MARGVLARRVQASGVALLRRIATGRGRVALLRVPLLRRITARLGRIAAGRRRRVATERRRRGVVHRLAGHRGYSDDLPLLPNINLRAVGDGLVVLLLGAHVLAVVRTQRGLDSRKQKKNPT